MTISDTSDCVSVTAGREADTSMFPSRSSGSAVALSHFANVMHKASFDVSLHDAILPECCQISLAMWLACEKRQMVHTLEG